MLDAACVPLFPDKRKQGEKCNLFVCLQNNMLRKSLLFGTFPVSLKLPFEFNYYLKMLDENSEYFDVLGHLRCEFSVKIAL